MRSTLTICPVCGRQLLEVNVCLNDSGQHVCASCDTPIEQWIKTGEGTQEAPDG